MSEYRMDDCGLHRIGEPMQIVQILNCVEDCENGREDSVGLGALAGPGAAALD
jgi:hypothetical protein